jgi:catechol 2,3-dioxygenase-like lactoylglutathione lyase family enzyme
MRFENPLVFTTDIAASADFYTQLLGLVITERHEDFVLFDGGFAIHDGAALLRSAGLTDPTPTTPWGRHNFVLYFRTEALHDRYEQCRARCDVIHPPRTEPWGETIFRIHDPDGHIIEIGDGANM